MNPWLIVPAVLYQVAYRPPRRLSQFLSVDDRVLLKDLTRPVRGGYLPEACEAVFGHGFQLVVLR